MNASADEIRAWIVTRVSGLTGLPYHQIDAAEPLTRYGLDSVAMISLAADLEKWLGYRFRSNPIEEHPTIEALAAFLAGELAVREKG